MKSIFLPGLTALLLYVSVSCRPEYEVLTPYDFNNQPGSGRFAPAIRRSMEGVYRVSSVAAGTFGQQVALKWSYIHDGADTVHTLSILTGVDAGFFNLQINRSVSELVLSGFWRKLVNQGTGDVAFTLQRRRQGQLQPYQGSVLPGDTLVLNGSFSTGTGESLPITLVYDRPLNPKPFEVLAHRAGGRTSDLLGVSENTVAIIRQAARFGATGIEVDVRYTKDSVPVLYHDNTLNQRLIRKNGLSGTISDYTYEQLQTSFDLIYGEKIPTLDEALQAVVEHTDLDFVYLDSKFTGSMTRVQALQQTYNQRARQLGRRLRIVIGIPNAATADAYQALANKADTPILCELDTALTRRLGAIIWAPRWTQGPQYEKTSTMQAEGREVFVWTLDDLDFLEEFSNPPFLNGILSNYSCTVAYYHYTAQ